MASSAGSAIVPVAMAFAVLRTGGTAEQLGLVLACGGAAEVALLLFGGVWADRLPRRTVVLVANSFSCALSACLGVLLIVGTARVWEFALFSVAGAVARAFVRPAMSGLVTELVSQDTLQKANALLSLTDSVPSVAGPAIAGVLVALAGAGSAFLVESASLLSAVLLLGRVSMPRREPPESGSFWAELRGGVREVTSRPWLWQCLISHGLWNLGFSMLFVLGPALLLTRHGGIAAWAAVSTGLTVGSILGALLALRIRTRRPLTVGNLALLAGAAPFIAMIEHSPVWVLVLGAVAAAAGTDVLGALWNSTLQQFVPGEKLSRVSACDWMVSLSMTPLGYIAAGSLSGSLGPTRALVVPVLLIVVPSTLVSILPSSRAVGPPPVGITPADADRLTAP